MVDLFPHWSKTEATRATEPARIIVTFCGSPENGAWSCVGAATHIVANCAPIWPRESTALLISRYVRGQLPRDARHCYFFPSFFFFFFFFLVPFCLFLPLFVLVMFLLFLPGGGGGGWGSLFTFFFRSLFWGHFLLLGWLVISLFRNRGRIRRAAAERKRPPDLENSARVRQ